MKWGIAAELQTWGWTSAFYAFSLALTFSCLVGCDRNEPFTTGGGSPSSNQSPPQPPAGSLFRPTFETTLGTIEAGTAFEISLTNASRPILLTAIHLLGPDGGAPHKVPAVEVPQVVKSLELKDCFDASLDFPKPGSPIVISEAAAYDDKSKAGDILAFWAPKGDQIHPFVLAMTVPVKGRRVWLAAAVLEGAPPTQKLHAATVTGIDRDGYLIYRFDNSKLVLQATSGAPVLNSSGEVVAINIGGGKERFTLFGFGNPVSRFRPFLEAAIKQQGQNP